MNTNDLNGKCTVSMIYSCRSTLFIHKDAAFTPFAPELWLHKNMARRPVLSCIIFNHHCLQYNQHCTKLKTTHKLNISSTNICFGIALQVTLEQKYDEKIQERTEIPHMHIKKLKAEPPTSKTINKTCRHIF